MNALTTLLIATTLFAQTLAPPQTTPSTPTSVVDADHPAHVGGTVTPPVVTKKVEPKLPKDFQDGATVQSIFGLMKKETPPM